MTDTVTLAHKLMNAGNTRDDYCALGAHKPASLGELVLKASAMQLDALPTVEAKAAALSVLLADLEALCGYPVGLPRRTYMGTTYSIKEA